MLADRLFCFDQRGAQGLAISWNKSENVSCLLSDIYYTMGMIALSQQMAFEAYVSVVEQGNPRMLQRLVQTNLIFGEYKVAEKYLNVLSKTYAYKDWAAKHRQYLYNDAAVEADPEFGMKRRGLTDQNHLALLNGYPADLEEQIAKDPTNPIPIHYLGALYLLSKDLESFQQLLNRYYRTEALPVLPRHFQEAVFVLSEKDPTYWQQFDVAPELVQQFSDYRKAVVGNKNNPGLAGLLARSYGTTYWYYFMFKK